MGDQRYASFSRHFIASSNIYQNPDMDNPYSTSSSGTTATASQNLGALGTLVGYIGAETATTNLFERLLWPQRFWNKFDFRNVCLTALFMPLGGPLHKAALQTLDSFSEHGLFRGARQGHMLGTPFFRDSKLPYTVWVNGEAVEHEHCRNNIWTRAVGQVTVPETTSTPDKSKEGGATIKRPIRAKNCLNHIVLEQSFGRAHEGRPVINHDTASPTFKVYAFVFVSEITAVIIGTAVATVWRSWLASLWFIPLVLKLLAVYFAIAREDLAAPINQDECSKEVVKTYEINDPHHSIFLVEGKDSTVKQFFRHYGHPIRNRPREILQFLVIAGLGLTFPLGLVCSVLWMTPSIQYLWLSYQLYTTFAMHVYRYANSHHWATTEQAIAKNFQECRESGEPECIDLCGERGCVVTATLSTTCYDNLKDAQDAAKRILQTSKPLQVSRTDSETTVCG